MRKIRDGNNGTSKTGTENSQSPETKVYPDTFVENLNEDKMFSDKDIIDNKNDYNQSSSNEILSGKVICLDPRHGMEDSSVHGFSILVPVGDLLRTPSIVAPSREAAEFVEEALTEIIDAKNRGIVEREDLTGFNWSEVPVILVEMGFLSNPEEDEKMATEEYCEKIAEGIANGVKNWLTE